MGLVGRPHTILSEYHPGGEIEVVFGFLLVQVQIASQNSIRKDVSQNGRTEETQRVYFGEDEALSAPGYLEGDNLFSGP